MQEGAKTQAARVREAGQQKVPFTEGKEQA
jgi:hypothetical protein